MRKVIVALAIAIAVAWSGPAHAVLTETTVTVTDRGHPIPNATIKLTRSDRRPPPRPKTAKTSRTGTVVVRTDKKKDEPAGVMVTITAETRDAQGKRHRFAAELPLATLEEGGAISVGMQEVPVGSDLVRIEAAPSTTPSPQQPQDYTFYRRSFSSPFRPTADVTIRPQYTDFLSRWDGFYIGANVGHGWGRSNTDF